MCALQDIIEASLEASDVISNLKHCKGVQFFNNLTLSKLYWLKGTVLHFGDYTYSLSCWDVR